MPRRLTPYELIDLAEQVNRDHAPEPEPEHRPINVPPASYVSPAQSPYSIAMQRAREHANEVSRGAGEQLRRNARDTARLRHGNSGNERDRPEASPAWLADAISRARNAAREGQTLEQRERTRRDLLPAMEPTPVPSYSPITHVSDPVRPGTRTFRVVVLDEDGREHIYPAVRESVANMISRSFPHCIHFTPNEPNGDEEPHVRDLPDPDTYTGPADTSAQDAIDRDEEELSSSMLGDVTLMSVTEKMELRHWIATVCGFTRVAGTNGWIGGVQRMVPNYLFDLNAMRDAESELSPSEFRAYTQWLILDSDDRRAICASAFHRAKAFAIVTRLRSSVSPAVVPDEEEI